MMTDMKLLAPGIALYRPEVPKILEVFDYVTAEDLWVAGGALPSRGKKQGAENYRSVGTFDFVVEGLEHKYDSKNLKKSSKLSSLGFFNYVKAAVDPCFDDYAKHYSIDVLNNETVMYQILKYLPSQRFSEHNDDTPEQRRSLSAVYYANSGYEGGEIYFTQFDLLYKPEAGDCLIFPSMWVYTHIAREVSAGIKYAVVAFRD